MSAIDILSNHGSLSQAITGFTIREAQLKMAEAIEKAIEVEAQMIIEAETGTGKTFGYLVPVFLAEKKTIISTGTKNLQDQLFFKDIPIIKKLFPMPKKIILLKGRANYLCLYRLQRSLEDGRFNSRHQVHQLHKIHSWSIETQSGDIAELDTIEEDSTIWSQVTSTADNCLNQDCEFYQKCFVVKARQQAMSADILVVNHHLFFADMALQQENFGELLPGAQVVIFDEAHHLPDIASQFFSTTLSSRQFIELARDVDSEIQESAKDMQAILDITLELQKAIIEMRNALGSELKRAVWPQKNDKILNQSIQAVTVVLQKLEENLKEAAVRSKALENCWRRSIQLLERFILLTGTSPDNSIHWYETYTQSFIIQLTPMVIAEHFKEYINQHKRTWIFTSATLTVQNSFSLFVESLGLNKAMNLQLKSPFDYQKQAMLYVPRGLPDARANHFIQTMLEASLPILEITQGRAFMLFTSYKSMEYAAEILKSTIDYPILVQGTLPKRQLIDEFKRLGNAVLLGTSSFWYGVDVRGDALSCVIIDKLPFAAPDDPVLQARIQMMRRQGVDPFVTYQLPNAVLILKQGAGRLIRDHRDRGILMICDPRLVGSHYGQAFLNSLPTMPRTRDLSKIKDFFKNQQLEEPSINNLSIT